MTRTTDRSNNPAGSTRKPAAEAPAQAADDSSNIAPILDGAVTLLTASGGSPELLQEVLALQANMLGGEVNEDVVVLLLEAAIHHHLPGILEDERAWARELARLAGI